MRLYFNPKLPSLKSGTRDGSGIGLLQFTDFFLNLTGIMRFIM